MTIPHLIQTIQATQQRRIAGDHDAQADLYGYRMQLLRALHLDRRWRCRLCHQTAQACRYDASICTACDVALLANVQRHCTVCGAVLPLDAFYCRPDTLTYRRICTPCYGAQCRERYPEARKAALERFLAKNPNYVREKNHARYMADPAAAKARTYTWREKNIERHQATQRAWRQRRKEA